MRRYPALRGRPLVVVEKIGLRELVLDYSAVAEAASVTEGMPLTDAIALCPQAVLMQADAKYYSDTHNQLADALAMRCPKVEVDGMGCLYASLEGLSEIHGRGGPAGRVATSVGAATFQPAPGRGLRQVPCLRGCRHRPAWPGRQGAPRHNGISGRLLRKPPASALGKQGAAGSIRHPHPGAAGRHAGRRGSCDAGRGRPTGLGTGSRNRPGAAAQYPQGRSLMHGARPTGWVLKWISRIEANVFQAYAGGRHGRTTRHLVRFPRI